MTFKLINAHDLREGNYILIDGAPCMVKSVDISKTGKHGASKVRVEAIGLIDDKKRVIARPGDDRLEVPLVEKKKGQVLAVSDKANIMDLDTFENLEVLYSSEIKGQLKEGSQVEYWAVEGQKIIKRVIGSS